MCRQRITVHNTSPWVLLVSVTSVIRSCCISVDDNPRNWNSSWLYEAGCWERKVWCMCMNANLFSICRAGCNSFCFSLTRHMCWERNIQLQTGVPCPCPCLPPRLSKSFSRFALWHSSGWCFHVDAYRHQMDNKGVPKRGNTSALESKRIKMMLQESKEEGRPSLLQLDQLKWTWFEVIRDTRDVRNEDTQTRRYCKPMLNLDGEWTTTKKYNGHKVMQKGPSVQVLGHGVGPRWSEALQRRKEKGEGIF